MLKSKLDTGLTLEITNTIDGAVEALTEGNAGLFCMWERFMTKPLVDKVFLDRT
jgi:hypothetical protein